VTDPQIAAEEGPSGGPWGTEVKYHCLGRNYPTAATPEPTQEFMQRLAALAAAKGLTVRG
jgi:hypothetical protein